MDSDNNILAQALAGLGASWQRGETPACKNGFEKSFPRLAIPGLSLRHHHDKDHHNDKDHRHRHDTGSRKDAEEHAVALLARPLREETSDDGSIVSQNTLLLQNALASFAVLVDSRLHAYSSFLARHALSIRDGKRKDSEDSALVKGIEEKLEQMLGVGSKLSAKTVETRFELLDEGNKSSEASTRLKLNVNIDFGFPCPATSEEVGVSVFFSTTGDMKGEFWLVSAFVAPRTAEEQWRYQCAGGRVIFSQGPWFRLFRACQVLSRSLRVGSSLSRSTWICTSFSLT
jgi:hypothetical protein